MNDASGHVLAGWDIRQGIHDKSSLHPRVHRVAHNPPGEHVLNGIEIKPALAGPVFHDVSQPRFVHLIRDEAPLHEVVVDRWARTLSVLLSLLPTVDDH